MTSERPGPTICFAKKTHLVAAEPTATGDHSVLLISPARSAPLLSLIPDGSFYRAQALLSPIEDDAVPMLPRQPEYQDRHGEKALSIVSWDSGRAPPFFQISLLYE